AIFFRCPGCAKAFRVPDERAGLKTNCTRCKTLMTVPQTSEPGGADAIEALAGATLSGEFKSSELMPGAPSTNGSAEAKSVGGAIAMECPFCFEQVEFPPDKGGKKAPCPQCRRILQVPVAKDGKPKDWREVDNRPSFARTDNTPAPE